MSFSVSVSFFLFPCSKGHSIRAYLDTIWVTLCKDSIFWFRSCEISHSSWRVWNAISWYSQVSSSNGIWWVIDKINVFNIGFFQTSLSFTGIILAIVNIKEFFMYFKKGPDPKADTIVLHQKKFTEMFIELQRPIGLSIRIYLFL